MENKKIIANLIEAYQDPALKDERYKLVLNEKEWSELPDKIDSEGLQLVLVGDNPGLQEMKDKIYFHPEGPAGRDARLFIKLVEQYPKGTIEKGNWLILNKTPFHSVKSQDLLVEPDGVVAKSMDVTIEALKKLASENPDLIILLVGVSRNDINYNFFPKLERAALESSDLAKKLRFAHHFSYGHFMRQWVKAELAGLQDEAGTTLFNNLDLISEETNEGLVSYHKINFSLIRGVEEMNSLFDEVVGSSKPGTLYPDSFDLLVDLLKKHSKLVLDFHEELERDPAIFLNKPQGALKNYRALEAELKKIKAERLKAIKGEDFQSAANFRDEFRRKEEELIQEIVELNGFKRIFNYFLGRLLLIPPSSTGEKNHFQKMIDSSESLRVG